MSGGGGYNRNQNADCLCCCACWRLDVAAELKGRMLRGGWIVPRKTMCIIFWVGILLLFAGIILLVTSKHKGIIFQAWGIISLAVGFILLVICLALCIHAYWVISHGDQNFISDTSSHNSRSVEHLKQRYELPPKYTATTASPKLSTTPNGRLKSSPQLETVIQIETGRSSTSSTTDSGGRNKSASSLPRDSDSNPPAKPVERHRLLEIASGPFAYYRTVPSTIDEEEEEISTNSVAPPGGNNSIPSAYHSLAPPGGEAGLSPVYPAEQGTAGGKAGPTGGPIRSIPLTNPPPLPVPPNNPHLISASSRSQEPEVTEPLKQPWQNSSLKSSNPVTQKSQGEISHPPYVVDGKTFLQNGSHSSYKQDLGDNPYGRTMPRVISNQKPNVKDKPFSKLDSDDIDHEFVPDFRVAIKPIDSLGRAPGKTEHRHQAGDRQVVSATIERREGGARSGGEHFPNRTFLANNPTRQYGNGRQAISGTYHCDDRVGYIETGGYGDESDLSPSMTIDWTPSDDSNPLSSTSDEGTHHRPHHNPRVIKTSPESVIELSVPDGRGRKNTDVKSNTLRHQPSMTMTQFQAEPSTRKVGHPHSAPALRAHTAALSDGEQEGRSGGTVFQPSGLMMRPFVDGTVTVTPLDGTDEHYRSYLQGKGAGAGRGAPGNPSQPRPPGQELEDLSTNMTECSIDSKVTIYDNVNYMNL